MKRYFAIIFCLLAFPLMASHIVGGEFEIIHISGDQYRVNLILYFDEKNGDPGAQDPSVTARIYRMRDNIGIMDVMLPFVLKEPVYYTQPECSSGEIKTSKIIYSTVVVMTPQLFSDIQGYYIVWERCCRNYSITNIYSENTRAGGTIYAGQTFYLEFPPVIKNGQPFINSTPRLFPPLNDYACPGRFYYADFAGTDDDGDSLVYSLTVPMNTKSADALPLTGPRPRPFPDVIWRPSYSQDNIMNGQPDLAISADGLLTVTPTQQGLFVFAVRCEEFRNGQKIGEVRRDFQMLVVDGCEPAAPPQILGKKLSDTGFNFDEEMSVTFADGVADEDRCIQVKVSDPDVFSALNHYQEQVSIRAIPLQFKKDMSGILPPVTNATLTNTDSTVVFDICFDKCPPVAGSFQIGVIAYDDACSLPLSDTLKITVTIEQRINSQPILSVTNTNPELSLIDNHQNVIVGQQVSLALVATDADQQPQDDIVIDLVNAEGTVTPGGYHFSPASGKGHAETTFVWNTDCSIFKDGIFENDYIFTFLTKDNRCVNALGDTVSVNITVKDVEANHAAFIPPNIITVNNDRLNDFFAMVRENKATRTLESILPPDNCMGRFIDITIYNRWGKTVFQSTNRDFRWYAQSEAAGVYFYTLQYSHKTYKGTIAVKN